MLIIWRGWGHLVFFVPFAWIFVLVGIMIGFEYYEPDPQKAAAFAYRLFALAFLLAAITLGIVTRYRARIAPGRDEFSFIPMRYWPCLVAGGAAVALAASFLAV